MYCIIEQETHPDRCIENVFGPYNCDRATIDEIARKMYNSPHNIIGGYGTKRSDFNVWDLQAAS